MAAFSNAKQSIPPLFVAIIENYDETEKIRERIAAHLAGMADFRRLQELRKEMRDFRRAAEKALAWNTDKGNAG